MDMISFGPIIQGAHSPDERVKVDSVGRFYGLLKETLTELAGG
jgi:dipeptidase D